MFFLTKPFPFSRGFKTLDHVGTDSALGRAYRGGHNKYQDTSGIVQGRRHRGHSTSP